MQGDTSQGIKTFGPEEINAMVLTKMKEISEFFPGKKATHEVCGEVESSFEGEDFSETLTRARFEKLNTDLFRETLKPVPKFLVDADLTKKETDELVPGGNSTKIPTVQSHFRGCPKGRNREREGEMGDNMRCRYIGVTKPRSVHCGDDAALHCEVSVQRGEAAVPS